MCVVGAPSPGPSRDSPRACHICGPDAGRPWSFHFPKAQLDAEVGKKLQEFSVADLGSSGLQLRKLTLADARPLRQLNLDEIVALAHSHHHQAQIGRLSPRALIAIS